jgi:hypothetical protein
MGHASYRITYDVYAEWIPGEDDAPNPLDHAIPLPTPPLSRVQRRAKEG